MFETKNISQLNELESRVFNAIVKEPEILADLTIRGFAEKLHLSTSTIVHTSQKLGFDGWAELKYYFKDQNKPRTAEEQHYDNMMEFSFFLKRLNSKSYQRRVNQAAQMIATADYSVFCGVGTSNSLSDYGSKYFANIGLRAFAISDPFQAVQINSEGNIVALILSESGDTDQVIHKALDFKRDGATIISITNNGNNSISKLADLNLSYDLQEEHSSQHSGANLTTQLPVLALLEALAHRAANLQQKQKTKN
ncbi:MAG: MurR/RpiR family transcriptional regulator [Streptococcaceae bacterium]|jgi:DNA-binding MurR/RpiR family transcriptional regulator|nr:MurR/RpiR family transcriptional regulator [Streptococcaceae bacterium]